MGFGIDPNKQKKAKVGGFAASYMGDNSSGSKLPFGSKYMAEKVEEKDASAGSVGPGAGEEQTGKKAMGKGRFLEYIPGGGDGDGYGPRAPGTITPGSKKTVAPDYPSRTMYEPRWAPGADPKDKDKSKSVEPGKFAPGFGPGGEVESTEMTSTPTANADAAHQAAEDAKKYGIASGERELLASAQGEGVDSQMAALEAQKQAGLAKLQAEEAQGTQELAQGMNEAGIGVSGAFGAGKEGYTTASALAQQQYSADVEVQKQQLALDWQIKKLETQLSVWGTTLTEENKKAIQDSINVLNQQKVDLEKQSVDQATYESASDVMQTILMNAIEDAEASGIKVSTDTKMDAWAAQGALLAAVQDGKMTYQEAQAAFDAFVSIMGEGGWSDSAADYAALLAQWQKETDAKYKTNIAEDMGDSGGRWINQAKTDAWWGLLSLT